MRFPFQINSMKFSGQSRENGFMENRANLGRDPKRKISIQKVIQKGKLLSRTGLQSHNVPYMSCKISLWWIVNGMSNEKLLIIQSLVHHLFWKHHQQHTHAHTRTYSVCEQTTNEWKTESLVECLEDIKSKIKWSMLRWWNVYRIAKIVFSLVDLFKIYLISTLNRALSWTFHRVSCQWI